MATRLRLAGILLGTLTPLVGLTQQPCPNGVRLDGTVTDPTGALVASAQLQTADGQTTTTDTTGKFLFVCVPPASKTVTVSAPGFAPKAAAIDRRAGQAVHMKLQLQLVQVQTEVVVGGDSTVDADQRVGAVILNTDQIAQLADDPDDLLRQLQSLAASVGADPGSTVIMVDGFQNSTVLPPKGSIASIRINPDMFAPEFQSPPYVGSLIQIFTKPGSDRFHGAVFFTDSDGSFNATDPFSLTATPAGKRRYGFELTGPIVRKKLDFSLALEKRDIDEFNVVNATTLDSSFNQVPFQQTVNAPQRLWIASAQGLWQVSPKDVANISFSARTNNLGNQGVGGLTLPDAEYDSLVSEYDLRLTNTQTLSANLLHETRIGYSWKRTEQTALSTAPSVQVAGYFTNGGATSQNLNNRERDLEIDDDIILTRGKHIVKAGAEALGLFVHDYAPNTFNGSYIFGGGSAPALDDNNQPTGQTVNLTPIQQYSQALQNLPGGSPTTYAIATGTPLVPFTQWRLGLYFQDTFKLTPKITLSSGLRYQFQTLPRDYNNFAPRVGVAWSPDKKQTWVFHLRAGMFYEPTDPAYVTEVERLNNVRQHQTTVYSPEFSAPLTPVPGSIQVTSFNQFQNTAHQMPSFSVSFNFEKDLARHWNLHGWYLVGNQWGLYRIRNINAPLIASGIGNAPDPTAALLAPRPIAPNENIFQYENTGHLSGQTLGAGLTQKTFKRLSFTFNYKYDNIRSDGREDMALSPQSSYSNKGESSTIDWNKFNNYTFSGNALLPFKVEVSTQLDARDGERYNVTTGTDNNGDGIFNDRPSFATPTSGGTVSTKFGDLTPNTVNGNIPRNLGIMPRKYRLDANLRRVFPLNPKDKDHPRSLIFNARAANLLNHTNVTGVGTVITSPSFGQALSAETARRLELGLRFEF